jgi:succinate dehydrogenase / fumarate reductase cytochrome b subunit
MDTSKPTPKYLNLLEIRLPPGAVASIAHRVSGVLMFLAIPLVAWLFAQSLAGETGFQTALAHLRSLPGKAVSLLLFWSLSHHLLAGVRHLLLDIDIGLDRASARASAWLVNLGALAMTAAFLVTIL